MAVIQFLLHLLAIAVLALFLTLFVALATGSMLFAFIVAGATGFYCGLVDARRARKEGEKQYGAEK